MRHLAASTAATCSDEKKPTCSADEFHISRTPQEHRYKGLSIYGFTVRKLTAVWSSVYRVPPVNSDITQICTKQPWDVSYASIVLCVETIRTYTSCCGPLGAANVVASYGSTDVVKDCRSCFAIDLPSCVLKRRQDKFILRYFYSEWFCQFRNNLCYLIKCLWLSFLLLLCRLCCYQLGE